MSNLIYIGDKTPINLEKVIYIKRNGAHIKFAFNSTFALEWSFDNEHQAKIVYTAILRSRCRSIGDIELTKEELEELDRDLQKV